MKAVQIGILGALVVCGALLVKVYHGQQAAPAAPAAAPAVTPAPAPEPGPAAAAPAPEEPAPAEPASASAHERKPSPAPKRLSNTRETAANRAPAKPAASRAPAQPNASPAAQTPAPAPAEQPQNPNPAQASNASSSIMDTLPPPPRVPHTVTIPAGALVSVRLSEELSSDRNQAGDKFAATLDRPLEVDGFVIAERGARVQGKVVEARKAGRVSGVSALAVQLVSLHTSDGQDVALNTEQFTKEGPTSHGSDAKKIGAGAALGAAIGAIAGGGKGAAIGAGVGGAAGAGTVAATRGKPTDMPVETRMTFRLQEPITLTERLK